jgi:hypothetical protein
MRRAYTASAHAVLSRFGQINTIKELNGKSVHRLENILTWSSEVHQWFDGLKIWLERKPDVSHANNRCIIMFCNKLEVYRILLTTIDWRQPE